jgi:uncharacterized protein (TIGR00730 family)
MTDRIPSVPRRLEAVCVYCGSASGSDPNFEAAAWELGAALAEADVGLVYGGGGRGLMGTLARSVLDNGGHVTGIIPDFLTDADAMLREAQEHIVVPDMHTRKRMMFERADAFVALPGGIGTLEELVEQLTWVQLERHTKPVLVADIGGFWRPLLALMEHMRAHSFINPRTEVRYLVAERVGDILPMLEMAIDRAARAGRTKETVDSRL